MKVSKGKTMKVFSQNIRASIEKTGGNLLIKKKRLKKIICIRFIRFLCSAFTIISRETVNEKIGMHECSRISKSTFLV
jgi:hypothetical protein